MFLVCCDSRFYTGGGDSALLVHKSDSLSSQLFWWFCPLSVDKPGMSPAFSIAYRRSKNNSPCDPDLREQNLHLLVSDSTVYRVGMMDKIQNPAQYQPVQLNPQRCSFSWSFFVLHWGSEGWLVAWRLC